MSLWEYKVITSGKGGFATPALLEKFLNDLGREEWEIVEFRSQPDNMLVFSGLARRSTQRDWTLEDAAAAAAKVEAEKLRAEFEAKFKAGQSNAPAAEERAPSFLEEKLVGDDSFRKPVDTSRDDDPEADDEKDDWDKLDEEDDLPSFFDAIKPHMRRNQRGPGQSVGVDYLAKKWDQSEEDLKGALVECGFEMPEDEDSKPVYVEYDGDLYWLNINRRGELWINTKEKPRPMFKAVKAQRVTLEEEVKPEAGGQKSDEAGAKSENGEPRTDGGGPRSDDRERGRDRGRRDRGERTEPGAAKAEGGEETAGTPGAPLPEGPALLEKIRPLMRRNRRGPGGSGSTSFLSRALKCKEDDLKAAFVGLGLALPEAGNDKPVYAEIGGDVWWLNADSRGGVWINGREKKEGETLGQSGDDVHPRDTPSELGQRSEASSSEAPAAIVAETKSNPAAVDPGAVLAGVRLLLKETKTGSFSGEVCRLAEELGKSAEEFVGTLVAAGLKMPEKPREKPVFVEHAAEIFWLNRNTKDELWLNAKASKFADKKEGDEANEDGGEVAGETGAESDGEKKPRRPRPRKKAD
jgi:hypothetical protein